MTDTRCILAETSLSVHNGGHVSICNGSRQMFTADDNTLITLDKNNLHEAWNSKTRLSILDALNNNIKHDNCSDCWIKEEAGFPSIRTIHNENLKYIIKTQNQPNVLILKPGNVCNLGCRHCDAKVSSGWYKDDYHANSKDLSYENYLDKFKVTKNSFNDENINWKIIQQWSKRVMHWDLYGAEPLLIRPLLDALQCSVDNKNAHLQTVHINTNGTIWRNEFMELFKNFKKVNLDISVDGIKEKFEYLRYPANWPYVLENILKYKKLSQTYPNIEISITVTISIYNILDLKEIESFFNNYEVNCIFNILHNPEHMNIRCLPDSVKSLVKQHLVNNFDNNLQKSIIDFLELPIDNKNLFKDFFKHTNQIDIVRNQKFKDIFPTLYEMIKHYE